MNRRFYLNRPQSEWPADSEQQFLKVLTDEKADESDRDFAARLAVSVDVLKAPTADAILRIIGDANESEALRLTCVFGLGPVINLADIADFENDKECSPMSRPTFRKIQKALKEIYLDESNPKEIRRRILEVSVQSSQPWHRAAIRQAFASGDREWTLTALFAMSYVSGFDREIVKSIQSKDEEVQREAISAAGDFEIASAWPAIKPLLRDPGTPKSVLLAAIDAVIGIRPKSAEGLLRKLIASADDDIQEAARDALAMYANVFDDAPPTWIN